MEDKELLELAARAAGLEVSCVEPSGLTIWDVVEQCPWNPLDDDGDALRLAVRLGIAVESGKSSWSSHCLRFTHHYLDEGPYVATRRAIVRAAAEIGKETLPSNAVADSRPD